MSLNKDNSHFWVRISHGLNKLVTNFNNSEQETSEVQFKENALKLDASDFACRSKARAKPQRREPAGPSTRTIPIGERTWTDVEPGEHSISDYEVSKKLIHLLRHGNLPREDDGAIEFWRIKDNLQKNFLHCHHWSDDKWKKQQWQIRSHFGSSYGTRCKAHSHHVSSVTCLPPAQGGIKILGTALLPRPVPRLPRRC